MQKWGNSFAVRIPRSAVRESGLREGEPLEIEASARQLRLRAPARRRYSLEELVAGIRRGNRHAEEDFGVPEGREAF
jgi:antitoxin MazE